MTLFIDASALVSIIAKETDALDLLARFETASLRLCSPLSNWETIAGLCRSYRTPVDVAREQVEHFVKLTDMTLVPIGQREWEIAVDAYARFGKGHHKAALNMGDCFAYACAVANGARLLFKGGDFGLTDVPAA